MGDEVNLAGVHSFFDDEMFACDFHVTLLGLELLTSVHSCSLLLFGFVGFVILPKSPLI